MGLRETKAARTRAQIIEAAIALFLRSGYDATTMEEIAERAEIGTSTLYRYFPSKELIVLEPFTRVGALAEALRGRPDDEPLELALADAIVEALESLVSNEPHVNAMREIIDRSPGPRARLWDLIAQERALLEAAVAERTGDSADSVRVRMTARTTQLVIELAADTWRSDERRRSLPAIAADVLAELGRDGIVLPVTATARRAAV